MASNRKIMVLPGDGIGTEIMKANMRIIDWMAKYRSIDFDMQEGLVGGAAYDVSHHRLRHRQDLPAYQNQSTGICLLYTSPSPRDS